MKDDSAIFAHIAQERAARALVTLCLVAAFVAAAFHGKGAALALALAAGLFSMARPGPSESLDKATRRGD